MMPKIIWGILFFLFGVFVPTTHASQDVQFDSCDKHLNEAIPKFKTGWKIVNADTKAVILNVSILPKDIRLSAVTSLVCKLAKDYKDQQTLVVWVLDNYQAAKQFNVQSEGVPDSARRAVRASCVVDREKRTQELIWTPDPLHPHESVKVVLSPPQ